jgi:hypothetical protein
MISLSVLSSWSYVTLEMEGTCQVTYDLEESFKNRVILSPKNQLIGTHYGS